MKSKEERFWAKVNRRGPDECWEWQGGRSSGYPHGILGSGPRGAVVHEYAHRVSWEIHNGPVPEGRNVLHHCDNPPCVNPRHLYVGTIADNNLDRDVRGRSGSAKLTAEQVRVLRKRRANGERVGVMARELGMNRAWLSQILLGKAWKHVP
jgi:hypothetical protein